MSDSGWIGHTGQVPGFTTTVYHHPDIDTTVVVEANSDISTGACRGQETLAPDPISAAVREPCGSDHGRNRPEPSVAPTSFRPADGDA